MVEAAFRIAVAQAGPPARLVGDIMFEITAVDDKGSHAGLGTASLTWLTTAPYAMSR